VLETVESKLFIEYFGKNRLPLKHPCFLYTNARVLSRFRQTNQKSRTGTNQP
jgi:hypothetical protein